jgi:hypothetical protein
MVVSVRSVFSVASVKEVPVSVRATWAFTPPLARLAPRGASASDSEYDVPLPLYDVPVADVPVYEEPVYDVPV